MNTVVDIMIKAAQGVLGRDGEGDVPDGAGSAVLGRVLSMASTLESDIDVNVNRVIPGRDPRRADTRGAG
jgi:hypothetical protein